MWYNGRVVNRLPSPQTFRCTKSAGLFWKQARFSVLLLACALEVELQDVILHAAVPRPLKFSCSTPHHCWRIKCYSSIPAFRSSGPWHVSCALRCVSDLKGWLLSENTVWSQRAWNIKKKLLKHLGNNRNSMLACGVLVVKVKWFCLKEWPFPCGASVHWWLLS